MCCSARAAGVDSATIAALQHKASRVNARIDCS
jgi:hypothetical protein